MDAQTISVVASSVACGLSTMAIGAIWWDIRGIKKEVKDCLTEQHQCQRTLPEKYATKDDTGKIWGRIDNHEQRVSYLEGLKNGAH